MGGVCSSLTGRGVHQPKVVKHGVKGNHAVIVHKHEKQHPTQMQQLLTSTFEGDADDASILAPVIASGHKAKKHYHLDEHGKAHHSFVTVEPGAKPRSRRASVDDAAPRARRTSWAVSMDATPTKKRGAHQKGRRASLPIFCDTDDDMKPGQDDCLAATGILAFSLESERKRNTDRRRSSFGGSSGGSRPGSVSRRSSAGGDGGHHGLRTRRTYDEEGGRRGRRTFDEEGGRRGSAGGGPANNTGWLGRR